MAACARDCGDLTESRFRKLMKKEQNECLKQRRKMLQFKIKKNLNFEAVSNFLT